MLLENALIEACRILKPNFIIIGKLNVKTMEIINDCTNFIYYNGIAVIPKLNHVILDIDDAEQFGKIIKEFDTVYEKTRRGYHIFLNVPDLDKEIKVKTKGIEIFYKYKNTGVTITPSAIEKEDEKVAYKIVHDNMEMSYENFDPELYKKMIYEKVLNLKYEELVSVLEKHGVETMLKPENETKEEETALLTINGKFKDILNELNSFKPPLLPEGVKKMLQGKNDDFIKFMIFETLLLAYTVNDVKNGIKLLDEKLGNSRNYEEKKRKVLYLIQSYFLHPSKYENINFMYQTELERLKEVFCYKCQVYNLCKLKYKSFLNNVLLKTLIFSTTES
jgi:hypothetical protein